MLGNVQGGGPFRPPPAGRGLTFALLGGGGGVNTSVRFFADSKKMAACALPGFHLPYHPSF